MKSANPNRPYIIAALLLVLVMICYFIYSFMSSNGAFTSSKAAPNFILQDLDGSTFEMDQAPGKVRLLEFMFTSCPDICPVTTYNMVLLQDELQKEGVFGDKVEFIAITFDPETDTPEVLGKYAERMGADHAGWRFLRGDEQYTWDVAASYDVSVRKLGEAQFVHSITSLTLIDANNQIRKVYTMGEDMDNAEILKDIATLIKE